MINISFLDCNFLRSVVIFLNCENNFSKLLSLNYALRGDGKRAFFLLCFCIFRFLLLFLLCCCASQLFLLHYRLSLLMFLLFIVVILEQLEYPVGCFPSKNNTKGPNLKNLNPFHIYKTKPNQIARPGLFCYEAKP